jgi:hypothetical protein
LGRNKNIAVTNYEWNQVQKARLPEEKLPEVKE